MKNESSSYEKLIKIIKSKMTIIKLVHSANIDSKSTFENEPTSKVDSNSDVKINK